MAFEIKPTSVGDRDLIRSFKRWSWYKNYRGEVILDLRETDFLAPWALTLFALYGYWLDLKKGSSFKLKIDCKTTVGRYAARVGLLEVLGKKRPPELAGNDGQSAPLTLIKSSKDVPRVANRVVELIDIEDEELESALKYSIVELLRNVVQHSGSEPGGICMAQYYPNNGLVEVVVADMGIGIRDALLPRYPQLPDDLSALRLSLLPHVSGTFANSAYSTMKDNAGLGLFFIKEIVTRSGGGFFLGSGKGLVDLWGNADGSPGKIYETADGTGWPGTFAYLQLRRDHIADFDSLLQMCRTLAAEARKDPTELRLDFIDEVPPISGLKVVKVIDFEEDVDEAARVREEEVVPRIEQGQLVVMDFTGVRAATQSFAHACLYRILRDVNESIHSLSIAGCTPATREALRAVAAYARTGEQPFGL